MSIDDDFEEEFPEEEQEDETLEYIEQLCFLKFQYSFSFLQIYIQAFEVRAYSEYNSFTPYT